MKQDNYIYLLNEKYHCYLFIKHT